jgi:hypothetical protein
VSSPALIAARARGGLPLPALARLERRFADALRHIPNSRVNLRLAVRSLVEELAAGHASDSSASRMVLYVTDHHPDRDDLDRTSMLTGERESDRLVRQMLIWVDEARAT